MIAQPGEREKALDFILSWITENAVDYLKICDPYFGPDELEIINRINSQKPDLRVTVLTSERHQSGGGTSGSTSDVYRTFWRLRISDQDPPDTEIVIVGSDSTKDLPVHDRWLITKEGGLRLGSSLNGLGVNKASEITVLEVEECREIERIIDRYTVQRIRFDDAGFRLNYELFSL